VNTQSIDIRTSLRAAVAVALASGVAHVFALGRSYWVIMVAVVVLAETWGASIQRAVQRVGATAAGCVVGWAVQRLAGNAQWVQVIMMLACIFLATYFRGYSYPWMMFFITVYVVFLFSLLGEWRLSIAVLRLEDTIVGGAVAIASTLIVPPPRADQLRADLAALWKCSQNQLAASLAIITPVEASGAGVEACRDNLYQTVETLRAHVAISPYENILRPRAVRRIRELVEQTEALGREVLMVAEIVQESAAHRLRPLEPELENLARTPLSDIGALRIACRSLDRRAAELQRAGVIGEQELLLVCSATAHLLRAGECVSRIVELRRQLHASPEVPATPTNAELSGQFFR